MSVKWPTNEEVLAYRFNDPELDNIKNFDYYAKSALMVREITREDYLAIEKIRTAINEHSSNFSKAAMSYLREVFANY